MHRRGSKPHHTLNQGRSKIDIFIYSLIYIIHYLVARILLPDKRLGMSADKKVVVITVEEKDHGQDAKQQTKKLPPIFKNLGAIGAKGSIPVVVLSGSSSDDVLAVWRICSLQCVFAWLVYMFRALPPKDMNFCESVIPNIVEIVDQLRNGQIDNERSIKHLLPYVFTKDVNLEFGSPNSFQEAFISIFTEGMGNKNMGAEPSIIAMGRKFSSPCLSACDSSRCNADTTVVCSRIHFMNFLWNASVKWTHDMTLHKMVNLSLNLNLRKRFMSTCFCGCGQQTEWAPKFAYVELLPMVLLVPCLTSYIQSEKGAHDFMKGDVVTLPAEDGDFGIYDMSAVSYISEKTEETNVERHIIIIMRGNEDPTQLYMYDSRTPRGAFVALQGAFPFVYVSSYGWKFHAENIILKLRGVRAAGGGVAVDV